MKIRLILLALFTFATLEGCRSSGEEVPEGVNEVLKPYFASFEEEAVKRGIEINLEEMGITGSFEDLSSDQATGQCLLGRNDRRVLIDITSWRTKSEQGKEALVFHELGHCALLRAHRNGVAQNSRCLSIMNDGSELCFLYFSEQDRSAFLDELFDPEFAGELKP